MAKNNNLTDFMIDLANTIRAKKGTTEPINPQDFSSEIESIGGGAEWQPDADMQWAKSVCENDTQAGFAYKVLQMVSDGYVYTDIVVPDGGAVKTSDGGYYTADAKHIWDDTNARQSEVGNYKIRWLIYYYSSEIPGITLLDEVIYACFDSVKLEKIFQNKKALQYFDIINGADLNSTVSSFEYVFNGCSSLQTIPLLNTSNITNMSYMFSGCSSLQTIPLLNTSNVTDMNNMFSGCSSLQTIPLLNTSNVTDMNNMFNGCSLLQSIPLLDTSKVTNMNYMFAYCYPLKTIPLLDTSKVTNMRNMFSGCYSLQIIPLLDTSNVTSMSNMFNGCKILQTIPLLNTSNVTDMSNMFAGCSTLKIIPLLNTSNIANMSYMFTNCYSLQIIPLLDTSNVTSMSNMLNGCKILQSVSLNLNSITSANNQKYLFSSDSKLEFLTLTNIKWNLIISNSTKYSHDTLLAIINNLVDLTGKTSQTLTMGSTNLAKLSDEEKAIATNKNWTLA